VTGNRPMLTDCDVLLHLQGNAGITLSRSIGSSLTFRDYLPASSVAIQPKHLN
jgi:hypothetical protein